MLSSYNSKSGCNSFLRRIRSLLNSCIEIRLFRKSVFHEIAVAVAGDDYGITIGVF